MCCTSVEFGPCRARGPEALGDESIISQTIGLERAGLGKGKGRGAPEALRTNHPPTQCHAAAGAQMTDISEQHTTRTIPLARLLFTLYFSRDSDSTLLPWQSTVSSPFLLPLIPSLSPNPSLSPSLPATFSSSVASSGTGEGRVTSITRPCGYALIDRCGPNRYAKSKRAVYFFLFGGWGVGGGYSRYKTLRSDQVT